MGLVRDRSAATVSSQQALVNPLTPSVGASGRLVACVGVERIDNAMSGAAGRRRRTLRERGEAAIVVTASSGRINLHANGIAGVVGLGRCRSGGLYFCNRPNEPGQGAEQKTPCVGGGGGGGGGKT